MKIKINKLIILALILAGLVGSSQVVLALTETIKRIPLDSAFNADGSDNNGGLISIGGSEVSLAKDPSWWNLDWNYKRQLTLKNLSSSTQPVTTTMQITLDSSTFGVGTSKLQADFDDLRVVYSIGATHTELARTVVQQVGATNVLNISFPLQAGIGSTATDANYYLYYGNVGASAPSGNAFSINGKNATLVCPFNGTTTCVGGQTPSVESGSIRYSRNSAMVFDGKNDYISTPSVMAGNRSFTVELWFRPFRDPSGIGKNCMLFQWDQFYILGANNRCAFYAKNGATNLDWVYLSSDGYFDNWHHLAITSEGDRIYNFFVDGNLILTRTLNQDIGGSSGIFEFGKSIYGYQTGLIDEIRVSDNVRYQGNFTPSINTFLADANTKLLYHFDENGDDPRFTGKAFDSSGNGNHGTIVGAKYVEDSPITSGSAASHNGIFIEEGTTNLLSNPSFENATYNLNWSAPYVNFGAGSTVFTANMSKRNSAGPFAAGPMVQGKTDGSGSDQLNYGSGGQITGDFYQTLDRNQGSVVFWVTPEWNGNDGVSHVLWRNDSNYMQIEKKTNNTLSFGENVSIGVSGWVAGNTYLVTARWDMDKKIDGSSNYSLSIGDSHAYGGTTVSSGRPWSNYIGYTGTTKSPNAIIEGLTVYRRVLFDGQYGTDVGNGDEINQIYNSGTGKDPTLVTGSWDVVFALPTNSTVATLTSGVGITGEAWSMPHSSNLLGTGGFMMGTGVSADGWSGYAVNQLNNPTFDAGTSGWSGTQSYLLRDEFSDTVAAGSVNGTTATDGVNTRTVVDGSSKLFVSDGKLNINGVQSYSDPTITYPTISRTAGRVLFNDVKVASSLLRNGFGSSNLSWNIGNQTVYDSASGININPGQMGSNLLTNSYAFAYRNTGAYVFYKEADGKWKFVWNFPTGTYNIIPKIVQYDTTLGQYDNIKVPTATFLPTPLAYDTFTRNDGVIGISENTGPDGQSAPQLSWSGGTISGGKMVITPTVGDEIWDTGASTFDIGTYSWFPYCTNTVENDSGSLKITNNGCNQDGAGTFLSAAADLSSNLTVGQWYQVKVDAKVNEGKNVNVVFEPNAAYSSISNTTFETKTINFRATSNNSNRLYTNAGSNGEIVWLDNLSIKQFPSSSLFSTVLTSTPDVVMDVGVSMTPGTQAGLVLNLDSTSNPQNFIIVYHNGSKLYVDEAVNGAYTNKQNTTVALGAGALRAVKDGTKLRVYLNNALVGNELTMTANSNTRHGVFSTSELNAFDNFLIFPRGSNGEYSGLPAEDLTVSNETTIKYKGAGSAKLVAGGNDANFVQSITVGNTATYDISAYAYVGVGQSVTSSEVNLYHNGQVNTTFTDAGGGWFKLSGQVSAAVGAVEAGVRVKAGKTVYLDNFSMTAASNNTYVWNSETAQKIFAGGYEVTSDQWGGIYKDIGVTSGQDVVIRGMAHSDGVAQPQLILWDQSNGAEIGSLYGTTASTVGDPDVLLFTGEAPAGCTNIRVKLVNAAESRGTVYWHQVEVYNNALDNGSFKTGAGNPWIPSSWGNSTLIENDSVQNINDYHSGGASLEMNTGPRTMMMTLPTMPVGRFYNWFAWMKADSGQTQTIFQHIGNLANQSGLAANQMTNNATQWTLKQSVIRSKGSDIIKLGYSGGTGLFDDFGMVALDPVGLTVTPASYANSVESSGFRVDGADTLTQTVTGLSATNGVIKFKFTPRVSFASASNLGSGFIMQLLVPGAWSGNSLLLYKASASQLRIESFLNGQSANVFWNSAVLNANNTYNIEINYQTGSSLKLIVDGAEVGSVSLASNAYFSVLPTAIYFGSDKDGNRQYDGTFSNITTSSVSENTTAPYFKYGSKSVKIDNSTSANNNEYTTNINVGNSATAYAVSAYVYDATTGNIGGDVGSSQVALYYANSAIGTTYTDVGGGWWRLTGKVLGVGGSTNVGVQVKSTPTSFDDFSRADSTTSMGNLASGQAWTAYGGSVWGIGSSQAYRLAGGSNPAIVMSNSGYSDGVVEVKYAAGAGNYKGLVFRGSNESNYWYFITDSGHPNNYVYGKVQSGVNTGLLVSGAPAPKPGDRLRAVLSGSSIKLYVNETLVKDTTDSFNSTATSHGLYDYEANSTTRFDDYRFYPPRIMYVDGVQVEQKGYSTGFTDTTRAHSLLEYSPSSVINANSGTISFWMNMERNNNNDPSTNLWGISEGFFATASNSVNQLLDGFSVTKYIDGRLLCSAKGSSVSLGNLNVGVWNMIALSWSGTSMKCYLNGNKAGETAYTGTPTIDKISFGKAYAWTNAIVRSQTKYSEARFFDNQISDSEVVSIYNEGLQTHQNGEEGVGKYVESGTYTSPIMDLGANGRWSPTLPWTATSADHGGSIAFFGRSVGDTGASWSNWYPISDIGASIPPAKYFQWKAEMNASEDKSQSPVISGMTVSYVEDTNAPENPETTGVRVVGQTQGSALTELVSGTWYNFAAPEFSWEAAVDEPLAGQSASGIDKYFVYLTSDIGATPTSNVAAPCYGEKNADDRTFSCALSQSGTYYFRVQTKDLSGNISVPNTLFTYKYDKDNPGPPPSVSTTTIGYSATNNFTFFWAPASDNGPAGIDGYEYKTGTASGQLAEWQFTRETLVADVPAYTEGQNTFYVRAKDVAGNYSTATTNMGTASFYYNQSAPMAPRNVAVSPATNVASPAVSNKFTITWDKPDTYSGEIAKYYYCVNCTPSEATMTETTGDETVLRKILEAPLATQQGKNTFYIVAEDNNIDATTGHGNRNFEAYGQAEFYAATLAPASPTNLTISDSSDRSANSWRLTLAWDIGSTVVSPDHYEIFRSTDNNNFSRIGTVEGMAYTDGTLEQSKSYYYKVRAVDDAGAVSTFSNVVSKMAEGKYVTPPSAGGIPSVAAGSNSAIVSWVTSRDSFGTVDFGPSSAYGSASSESVATKNHSIKISGLAAGATYHFRVLSLDDSELVGYERADAYSADYNFTTLAAPTITDVSVDEVGLDSATISWKTRTMASVSLDYGLTTEYGYNQTVSTNTSENIQTTRLTGLSHSTSYHFKIKGVTADGDNINSDDYSFETITFPEITAYVLKTDQSSGGTTIAAAWSSNVPTSSVVEYETASLEKPEDYKLEDLAKMSQEDLAKIAIVSSGKKEESSKAELASTHLLKLSALEDGTIYLITIKGRDKYGNEVVSDPIRYITGKDTRAPVVKNVTIETQISGGQSGSASVIVSWETDEPATTQVIYGSGTGNEYPESTPEETGLTLRHIAILRDLQPNASYHLQIKSADETGNLAQSDDLIAVTPGTQESALDIVLQNLQDVFGFLNL